MKHKSSAFSREEPLPSARFDIGWLPQPAAARRDHWLGPRGLGRRSPTVAAARRATSSPWSATYQQLYICERRRGPQAGEGRPHPLRHYRVVESGGGGGRSHAGASDSSLCATMLERTGGVLWVTRRKWTDWGQAVSNQSEISLIERGLGREGYWARPNALLSFYVQCFFFRFFSYRVKTE